MTAWVRVLEAGEALSGEEAWQVAMLAARDAQIQLAPPALLQVRFSLLPDTAAFTGRDKELDRITTVVKRAAAAGRLVAIDGMPGIGKTTLAIHAAHVLKDQFPDRQLFINLQAHTPGQEPLTPEAALAELLTAIGVEASYLPPGLPGRTVVRPGESGGSEACGPAYRIPSASAL